MSKKFQLVIGSTYANLKSVFRAGETYTEDQLGKAVDAVNEDGDLYFAEVDGGVSTEGEATVAKHRVVIGKAKKLDPEEGDGKIGGVDSDKVTV